MTATFTVDKKKIFRNTLLLYIRMAFVLLAGFCIVRLLLKELGVIDYGIYNTIFGLISLFIFFRSAMAVTVQRFLCHEIGQSQVENARRVFEVSIFLFLAIALILLIFAETAGLWFVHSKINIPPDRLSAALIIYQISIFAVLLKLLQIPFIAVITSHENMKVFSRISILECFLHLTAVFCLNFISGDKLIYFAALYACTDLLILTCYAAYCCRKYEECSLKLRIDFATLKSIFSHFGWNVFGSAANISKQQGLNLLLNLFCGVILNATWGIASQVGNAANQFVSNFQQAFNPQILKSYTNPDKKPFLDLLQNASKYSFLLIWLVTLPILLQTEFLLKLWLNNKLPEDVVLFTQWTLVFILFDALCGPMWVAIQATGNIRRYQIQISCLIGMTFVLSLLALKFGAPAYSVAVINAGINALTLIYRLYYMRREINFPVYQYCTGTLLPLGIIAAVTLTGGMYLKHFFTAGLCSLIVYVAVITLLNAVIIFLLGLTRPERSALFTYIRRKCANA